MNFCRQLILKAYKPSLAGSLALFVLRESPFECSRSHSVTFVSSRGKNFKVGNFFSRVASQINYITKKNNGPLFYLEKSTQEGKNNGGRVGNGMGGGGGAKGKSHQSQGKCVQKKTERS